MMENLFNALLYNFTINGAFETQMNAFSIICWMIVIERFEIYSAQEEKKMLKD